MKSLVNSILLKPYVAIAYSLLILYLCLMPSENIPNEVDDKLAHFLAFGGVGFLYYFVGEKKLFWLGLAVFFGVLIELLQGLLPADFHRGYDEMDMVYDAIGVLIGGLSAYIFGRLYLN